MSLITRLYPESFQEENAYFVFVDKETKRPKAEETTREDLRLRWGLYGENLGKTVYCKFSVFYEKGGPLTDLFTGAIAPPKPSSDPLYKALYYLKKVKKRTELENVLRGETPESWDLLINIFEKATCGAPPPRKGRASKRKIQSDI